MNAIERLRRDHAILRSKLLVLESALAMGQEAWYVLREMAFTLAKQLRDHIRREERLIEACRERLDPAVVTQLQTEHQDEPAHLRVVMRLFTEQRAPDVERIRPVLRAAIAGLRTHMNEEEQTLFPVIEQVLAGQTYAAGPQPQTAARLDETMTVNRLLQEHPRTRPVLERLFISAPLEGCYCLDEVAWRHGLETEELLKQLEDGIRAPQACPCQDAIAA